MIVYFKIPMKPFSINSMYYRDQRIKTTEAREWSENIRIHLLTPSIQPKIISLKSNFDKKLHGIIAELKYFYPSSIIFNKKKELSSKCFDITNVEKPLIDLIFLQPEGLDIDDKYLLECNSSKKISPDDTYFIEVKLEIVTLSEQFKSLGPI